jgi:DNA-binding SARP family transcriptional activator
MMRCYSHLDQNIQAIRHYHICVEALKNELDVAPEASTRQLYEQIRHREQI